MDFAIITDFLQEIMPSNTRLIATILIIVVFAVLLDRIIVHFLKLQERRAALDRRAARQVKILARYFIGIIAIFFIVGSFGVDIAVIAAGAGIIGIALGIAAQDLLANFLSGIFLIFDKTFTVNDVVKIQDTFGVVRLVTLRTTQIKTFDNNIVTVPNSTVANSTVVNLSAGTKYLFTSVVIRVGYSEDLIRIAEIMRNAIPKDDRIHIEEGNDVRFEFQDIDNRFQGSKVVMYFKVVAQEEPWIRSLVRREVINALMKEHVEFQKDSRT